MEETTIIRILDRTPFWMPIIKNKGKWHRSKWGRKIRRFVKDKKLVLSGTAFLFPEPKNSKISEALFWLECGFDFAHGKIVSPKEAKKLGKEYAWTISSEHNIAIVKCDEEGTFLKRTHDIDLNDFRRFLEEEVWQRKSLLRDAVLAFLETGNILLGLLKQATKALRYSL